MDDDEIYCMNCGSDFLDYIEQYADSEEWRCKDCGEPVHVTAQRREASDAR